MASTLPAMHGLSRDVTLAVLPRLYIEELVAELTRRNICFGGYSFQQEILVGMLKDVMTQEYRTLEPGKYPPDDFSGDRNVEFMPNAELAEREQSQGQILQKYSQTLSRICPSPNIENSLSAEAATQLHDMQDTYTNQESQIKYEGLCSEACLDANGLCSSNSTSASAVADDMEIGCASEGTKIVISATTRPTSELGNTASTKAQLEDDNPYNDGALDSIDRGVQNINNGSISNEENTCSKALEVVVYSCKDCDYGTNERSDFIEHTRIHYDSSVLGIKQEEVDRTFLSQLTETRQGNETRQVTTMVDQSNAVVTNQYIQADLHMTEPGLQNSEHESDYYNDEKVPLNVHADGERIPYESKIDVNKTHDSAGSDSHGVDNENENIRSNDSGTYLKPKGSILYSYACKECDYRTKVKHNFVRHTRIHTGEKPFMCPYCKFRTTQSTHLKTHMLRHSGEKPYKCSDCDFKTARKACLVEHMRKHTGEKPYMCDECGYRTSYRSNIASHMKKHLV